MATAKVYDEGRVTLAKSVRDHPNIKIKAGDFVWMTVNGKVIEIRKVRPPRKRKEK